MQSIAPTNLGEITVIYIKDKPVPVSLQIFLLFLALTYLSVLEAGPFHKQVTEALQNSSSWSSWMSQMTTYCVESSMLYSSCVAIHLMGWLGTFKLLLILTLLCTPYPTYLTYRRDNIIACHHELQLSLTPPPAKQMGPTVVISNYIHYSTSREVGDEYLLRSYPR